ncbi:MAG: hypothetical protein COB39_01220 [Marinosulfonomonas sp.]|nr:MAG: hypothetical protein COB39_01220 [Marinosulfonomonas sp.]
MRNIFTKSAIALAALSMATAVSAKGYNEVEVTDGGSFVGTVSAGDSEPDVRTYTISKDPDACGEGSREVPFVAVNDAGMLMNSVVFLSNIEEGKAMPEELMKLTIDQVKCEFTPHLGVMANTGELTAINSDHTLHNIHAYELIGKARKTVLNVSQPSQGDVMTKDIKLRRGNGIKVECDAHDFMHSFIYVAKTPYFSVVDEVGAFSITDIPAGEYKVMMWHGFLGEKKVGSVTVDAGGEVTMELSY